MGMITISTHGSFPTETFSVSAEEGGHANAIQRAICWLTDRQPQAIILDHKLHAQGDIPQRAPFGMGVVGVCDTES